MKLTRSLYARYVQRRRPDSESHSWMGLSRLLDTIQQVSGYDELMCGYQQKS